MSVPKQKTVLINRTTPPEKNYFKISHDMYFLAAAELTPAGLSVYMYFTTVVPDTWDGIKNKDNHRTKPYEISSSAIAEVIKKDTKTVQRGINDLINKGYLQLIKDNVYQFIDILPEHRCQTPKEHEQVKEYESMILLSMDRMKTERQQQLKNISVNGVVKQFDWETDTDFEKRKQTFFS